MISDAATRALSHFLSALFAPELPDRPIASPQHVAGQVGQVLHFSTGSSRGRVAHLVIRGTLWQGQYFLAGRLFDGDPYTVARQAESWYESPDAHHEINIEETGTAALNGFVAAIFEDQLHRPLRFRSVSSRPPAFLQFATESPAGETAILAICVTNEGMLDGCCFNGRSKDSERHANAWLIQRLTPTLSEADLGDWVSWMELSPHDVQFSSSDPASIGAYIRALEKIEGFLIDRGFSTARFSRIAQYRKALVAYRERRSDETLRKAFQATFEARQIIPIFEYLADFLTKQQIDYLISGAYSPELESGAVRNSSAARNFQFELYMAAMCKKAGFAVQLSSPDIVVQWDEYVVSIETKRIRSHAAVRNRARHAKHQTGALDIPGIVILDLTLLYNPDNFFVRAYSDHRARSIVHARLEAFWQQHEKTLREQVGASTCAYFLHLSVPVMWIGDRIGTFTGLKGVRVSPADDARADAVRDFVRRLTRVIS